MAAKEERLSLLHEKLTDLFLEIVECGDEIPSATLKTMTSFLKDNDVTCQPEDAGMDGLRAKLEKKKRLASVSPIDPLANYEVGNG